MINPALEKDEHVVVRKRFSSDTLVMLLIIMLVGSIVFYIFSLKETISELNEDIIEVNSRLKQSELFSESLLEKLVKKGSIRAKITMYHPPSGGINSDLDPTMTATMTKPIAGKTCAISTKMVEEGWFGKEIYIEGLGIFIANDRLNKDIGGYQIDVCASTKKEALKFGVREKVLTTIIDRDKIKAKTGG